MKIRKSNKNNNQIEGKVKENNKHEEEILKEKQKIYLETRNKIFNSKD